MVKLHQMVVNNLNFLNPVTVLPLGWLYNQINLIIDKFQLLVSPGSKPSYDTMHDTWLYSILIKGH